MGTRRTTLQLRDRTRKLVLSLPQTLQDAGASNVLMKRRGSVAIAAEAVDCDYYRFLDTDTPVPANLWCSTNGRTFTAGFSDG